MNIPSLSPEATAAPQTQQPVPQTPSAPSAPSGGSGVAGASASTQQAPGTTTSAPSSAGPAASAIGSGDAASRPSADVGQLLSQSANSTGVEVQRRNAVTADPRVRGYHVGQLVTFGDGAFYFPARQDLDSVISKFDPGSIRDILVIKGPYATRYGPGFAFLDINSLDSPRYENGFEYHSRTLLGYQTNGQRWTGLASLYGGAEDYGFRLTYNLLQGNDYRDGAGNLIPSSYLSNNVSYAIGFDLDDRSKIELKGLRVYQQNVEFPGLFFDINNLNTEGYSLRYSSQSGPLADEFIFDVWYNYTVADGDTSRGAKQRELNSFLNGPQLFNNIQGGAVVSRPAFGSANILVPSLVLDDISTTNFAQTTLGYRTLARWGKQEQANFFIGTDFTYLTQSLNEFINLKSTGNQLAAVPGYDPAILPGGFREFNQNLGIPNSNYSNPGLFVEGYLPLGDRLTLRTGSRVDYVNTRSGNRLITSNIDQFGLPPNPGETVDRAVVDPTVFSTQPWNTETSRDFGLYAAFIQGTYKFDEHIEGQMGFGYAMRPPTLTELYASGPFLGVLQTGLNRVYGDPRLEPEKVKQFDVGLSADYEMFRGRVNAFYAWVDDYITFDRILGPTPNVNQVVFTNTDRATLAGGELYTEFDATCWMTPFSAISYVQGRDLTHRDNRRQAGLATSRGAEAAATEPLPGIPPLEFRSGVRVHEASKTPKWQVEFTARSVWGQGLVASSLAEQETAGFTVFDLRAFWQATDRVLLTAGVENFGDKYYREHLDPLALGGLFRPGTNFYFSTQYTY